jgi:DnaJ domain/Domain of unknown function (DUF4388)
MNLPGRLRITSLGDLLGMLHRGEATGVLELTEDRGRTHRIFLTQGLVAAVEMDGASPTLADLLRSDRATDEGVLRRSLVRALASRRLHGDVLTAEFGVPREVVDAALRRQVLERLGLLDRLPDARVGFRVASRAPTHCSMRTGPFRAKRAPLQPRDFLHGRRRSRERQDDIAPQARTLRPDATHVRVPGSREPAVPTHRSKVPQTPWEVLGVAPGAAPVEIKQAYRRLARALHPDGHPQATEAEQLTLRAQFAHVTEAYRALT